MRRTSCIVHSDRECCVTGESVGVQSGEQNHVGPSRRKKVHARNEMLMVAGRAQVPGSTWTSGSPALRSSSSGLGPRRLPSWDPLSRKQRKRARRYVTGPVASNPRCWGGRDGQSRSQPPGESHPNPDPPGAVWKLTGDRACPRDPLPVVKRPRPGVEAAPSGAVGPAPPGVEMLCPEDSWRPGPCLTLRGPSNAPHPDRQPAQEQGSPSAFHRGCTA